MFYSYGGLVELWDLEWIQRALNVLIGLSRRVGLVANVAKYNTITCHMGAFFTGMTEEAFSRRIPG